MDSRAVTREIRRVVWAGLRPLGFRASGRSAWRQSDERVEVVNFQSFNAYNAEVLGTHTFSFAVNLGVWLRYVPPMNGPEPKEKDGLLRPNEWECPLRHSLRKRREQPEFPRPEIWHIRADGSNVEEAVADAWDAISAAMPSFFERFSNPSEVLRTLLDDDEGMDDAWGFGGKHSPSRNYLTAYVASYVGRRDVAVRAADELLARTDLMEGVLPDEARARLERLRERAAA